MVDVVQLPPAVLVPPRPRVIPAAVAGPAPQWPVICNAAAAVLVERSALARLRRRVAGRSRGPAR